MMALIIANRDNLMTAIRQIFYKIYTCSLIHISIDLNGKMKLFPNMEMADIIFYYFLPVYKVRTLTDLLSYSFVFKSTTVYFITDNKYSRWVLGHR